MVLDQYHQLSHNPSGLNCSSDCKTRTFSIEEESQDAHDIDGNTLVDYEYYEDNIKVLYMRISSPVIEVHTEYEVYDFNLIVGCVGGSLGLFVGFSFFDFLLLILDRSAYFLTK